MSSCPLIELQELEFTLPLTDRPLFKIDKLIIGKNDHVLIKGASGKGKTTLLHIMAGFIHEYKGKVQFLDRDLNSFTEQELCNFRSEQMSFIFQKLNLIPNLTSLENLELINSTKFNIEFAKNLLITLNLESKINTLAGKLSSGEQQRVACARAIMSDPKIIFADEPTSSLDDNNTKLVMETLINKSSHLTLIVVSHDYRLEKYFSNIIHFEELISK